MSMSTTDGSPVLFKPPLWKFDRYGCPSTVKANAAGDGWSHPPVNMAAIETTARPAPIVAVSLVIRSLPLPSAPFIARSIPARLQFKRADSAACSPLAVTYTATLVSELSTISAVAHEPPRRRPFFDGIRYAHDGMGS